MKTILKVIFDDASQSITESYQTKPKNKLILYFDNIIISTFYSFGDHFCIFMWSKNLILNNILS
jgi:hypothetical protein